MIRYAISALTAAVVTFGAVAAVNAETPKVSINRVGEYCVTTDAITGSHIAKTECHTAANWAKDGVTFTTAPKQIASR